MVPFETDNLRAYGLLLRIEVILRELLRISMETEHGSQWSRRLPSDLLKKINDSQRGENRPQFGYTRLGPLYYLTFGDLLKVIQQKSGQSVAAKLGGDGILKQLENLFVPRNAVCHSRPVSIVGLMAIETLYAQIEAAITLDGLNYLINTPDTGLSQDQAIGEMIPTLESVLLDADKLPATFDVAEVFRTALAQFWWEEDALAGFDRLVVQSAFECIQKYNTLPTGVGSAGIRLRFIEQTRMKECAERAISELRRAQL